MKESFDQHAGKGPRLRPARGRRRTAAARRDRAQRAADARAASAARWTRGGSSFGCHVARSVPHARDASRSAMPIVIARIIGRSGQARWRRETMRYGRCPKPTPADFRPRAAARAAAAARPPRAPATFLLDRVADDLAERLAAGAAAVRSRARSRHARRRGARGARRPRSVGTIVAGRHALAGTRQRTSPRFVVADEEALPFRDAALRSRGLGAGRCSSSTICRARSCRSAARSSPTACFSPR